jgi:hypothetical protein
MAKPMSMLTEMNGLRRCKSLLCSNRAAPRSTYRAMKTQSHAFHALACLPMAVALVASAAVEFATDAVVILAIGPASSIAQPRCMETAV